VLGWRGDAGCAGPRRRALELETAAALCRVSMRVRVELETPAAAAR
jgi:hypothetical protein